MRRIVVACAVAGVFAFTMLSSMAADKPATPAKAKTVKTAPVPSYGNADAISQEELKVYDYYLASDQLEGRYFPSRGYDTAALYVASHLAEWGLKPGGSTTGTNGPMQPYFVPIEMVARTIVAEDSKASLTAPAAAGRGGRAGGGAPSRRAGGRGSRGRRRQCRFPGSDHELRVRQGLVLWGWRRGLRWRRWWRRPGRGRSQWTGGRRREPGFRGQRIRHQQDQYQSLYGPRR